MLDQWQERRLQENPRQEDKRDGYERDRSRIIHSAAFRRLQAKTQVLGVGEGDFHRTRLTHSMEAAQISRGLHYILNRKASSDEVEHLPPLHLLEAICLAHDLGHPPFGHTGEAALNLAMHKFGGFEGNGQTLRLLSRLETHTEHHGLNPTRRTLLGVLKYPVPYSTVRPAQLPTGGTDRASIRWKDWSPPKCFHDEEAEIVEWILKPFPSDDIRLLQHFTRDSSPFKPGKPKYSALDTSILTLADDIAFGVHDIEDAVALGLVAHEDLTENIQFLTKDKWATDFRVSEALEHLFSRKRHERKQATGNIVNALIQSVQWERLENFTSPILKYNARLHDVATKFLEELRSLNLNKVIKAHSVQTLEYRGGHLVLDLFRAISADPERLLPNSFRSRLIQGEDALNMRVICDYISGMTDEFATKQYERLYVPRRGSALSPI